MPNETEKGKGQNQGNSQEKSGGGMRQRPDDPSRRQNFNYDDEPEGKNASKNAGKNSGSGQPSGQPSQPWQDRDEGNTNNPKH